MAFGFTACDGDDLGLLGSITLTSSNVNGDQPYANDQQFNFHSAICNVNLSDAHVQVDDAGIDTTVSGSLGAVFVGTTESLLSATDFDNITYPLCGIRLNDTVTGTYTFSYNVDWSLLELIDTTNFNKMITDGIAMSGLISSIFVVASGNDAFYLGISGNVNITTFGSNGETVDGTINNVNCIYITAEHLENLMALTAEQRNSINPATEFPTITFNGSMSSRRADIQTVMNALDNLND